jgi:hypothetical protein
MGDSVLPVVADYGDQFLRLVAEGEEVACLGVLLHEQQVDDSDHLLALELGGILHDRVVGLPPPAKSIASVLSFSAWGSPPLVLRCCQPARYNSTSAH